MVSAGDRELDLGQWTITKESVQEYLAAVGDTSPIYLQLGIAPPLCLAARVLGILLKKLNLPAGTIHSLQDVDTLKAVEFGQRISGAAQVGRPKRRGGLESTAVSYTLRDSFGEPVLTGKTTVMLMGSNQNDG